LYVVYDYEAVVPQTVTGPVNNVPAPPTPTAPPPAPSVSKPQPLGPMAYGAVRFAVPEGAETELTLHLLSKQNTTPGSVDPSVGTLFGCLVSTPGWPAAQNGRYDQGPKWDCSTADQADFSGDAIVFNFPSSMVQNGAIDVAIIGAGTQPFQMSIDKPVDSSIVVTNADELLGDVALDEAAITDDATFEDPIAAFDAGAETFDSSFTGEIAYSSDEGVLASVPAGASKPRPQVALNAGSIVNPFSPDASRAERIMAVAVLLIMGTGLWWVGGMPMRQPRLLGSLGNGRNDDAPVAASPGGIGRFARLRSGRPPRLF
jgi:hypothetical protein